MGAAGGRQPLQAAAAAAATEPALPQAALPQATLQSAAIPAATPPAARPQHQQHLPPQPLQLPQPWNSAHEPAALPAGWRQAVAPDGRTYYENDMTKVTQWEHPGAAAADGRAYDQMATTNADWTALDSDGNRMPVDVYANCRKFWFGAAQGQVEGPPQTFPAGGAHPHQHDLPLFGAAQGQVAGPPQTFPAGGAHPHQHDLPLQLPSRQVGLNPSKMQHSQIFVGGLSQGVDNAGLRAYFETYGPVYDAHVKRASMTGRSRGGDRRHVGARVIDRCD